MQSKMCKYFSSNKTIFNEQKMKKEVKEDLKWNVKMLILIQVVHCQILW